MHIYGVTDTNEIHTDVSKTERGAKKYATRHGYDKVSIRYIGSYNVVVISIKNERGRWVKPSETNKY